MPEEYNNITDEQIDAYLDGQLSPDEREALEAQLRAQPELAADINMYAQLDSRLKELFPVEQVSDAQVTALLSSQQQPADAAVSVAPRESSKSTSQKRGKLLRAALIGLAASLVWLLFNWQLTVRDTTPFFKAQPVAMVYQEIVRNGFEPYYECREEDRFADTFLRRQGKALRLAPLATGSHMLGLSYAGGLSRNTTAMLCEVEGQRVVVFVDRLEADLPLAQENTIANLYVHRVARDGLVFYEVSPFGQVRVIDAMVAL